jgi:hypothetical protein
MECISRSRAAQLQLLQQLSAAHTVTLEDLTS